MLGKTGIRDSDFGLKFGNSFSQQWTKSNIRERKQDDTAYAVNNQMKASFV